jgi:hypothetical protein
MKKLQILFFASLAITLWVSCGNKSDPKPNNPDDEKPVVNPGKVYDTTGLKYKSYTGLVMAGYQGWFAAEGDGSQRGWYHYQGNGGFYPGNTNVDFWPDITEYTKTYKSPFKFANGSDAYLYSPYDEESVDLHFKWMKDYGIDGVHMQRFVGEIKSSNASGKRHFQQSFGKRFKSG